MVKVVSTGCLPDYILDSDTGLFGWDDGKGLEDLNLEDISRRVIQAEEELRAEARQKGKLVYQPVEFNPVPKPHRRPGKVVKGKRVTLTKPPKRKPIPVVRKPRRNKR